jgi:hypothetical protein
MKWRANHTGPVRAPKARAWPRGEHWGRLAVILISILCQVGVIFALQIHHGEEGVGRKTVPMSRADVFVEATGKRPHHK